MRSYRVLIIAAATFMATRLIGQPLLADTKVTFAGTWEGKMNDLPGIDLKIEESEGKISGVMTFYFQERSDPNGPWHVASENPVPLLVPHVEGKTLTFEVQHHKCHTCQELGPNVKFRMDLVGPNEARLWKLENEDQEKTKDLGPGMKLVRRTESPA